MKKIKAKIKINDYLIQKEGIINNDILTLKDDELIFSFDYKNLILTNKGKDYEIQINFKNGKVCYIFPETSEKFYNNFTILSLTNNNKQVMINYQIEKQLFSLHIKYETIN